jgi:hypothetical protein
MEAKVLILSKTHDGDVGRQEEVMSALQQFKGQSDTVI